MHYSHHETLASFCRAYSPEAHAPHMRWDDVASLIENLEGKALVQIHPDDSVTVMSLNENPERYCAQTKYKRKHSTKLSFSVERCVAARFSAACKSLGVTQGSVLMPVIEETIRKADGAT